VAVKRGKLHIHLTSAIAGKSTTNDTEADEVTQITEMRL
jgi:hypothetical protein